MLKSWFYCASCYQRDAIVWGSKLGSKQGYAIILDYGHAYGPVRLVLDTPYYDCLFVCVLHDPFCELDIP
jgi:hypothetical protein